MLYACNYSPELMAILKENNEFCDYIKIGAFGTTLPLLEEAFLLKPLLIHGFGWFERGGMDKVEAIDLKYMNTLLDKYKTPFLGMHALAFEKDLKHMTQPILDHMTQVFEYISQGLETELTIENMDSSPFYTYDTTTLETVTPEFITQLLKKTGLFLLLDISHALVSSYQLGIPIYEYLEALPLEKIREIHFTGSFFRKEHGYLDIHGIMNVDDIELASFLAKHPRLQGENLKMVTLEYGGLTHTDKEAIIEQMKQLKELFH